MVTIKAEFFVLFETFGTRTITVVSLGVSDVQSIRSGCDAKKAELSG
jgi:hypothetical protein